MDVYRSMSVSDYVWLHGDCAKNSEMAVEGDWRN